MRGMIEGQLQPLLDSCLNLLRREFGPDLVSVVLYGSAARGTAGSDSDVDLLVVAGGLPGDRWERADIVVRLNMSLEGDLDALRRRTGWYPYLSLLLYTPDEAARFRRIYLDMVEEARLLHDADGFFQVVLDRARERMRQLGCEKVWVGKKWYWRLKADYQPGEEFEL